MDLFLIAATACGVLIITAVVQAALGAGFCLKLSRYRRELLPDDQCPPAAVVLCLRGSDPFLEQCLEAILAQDYPSFELHVVVDHVTDPALPIAEEIIARSGQGRAFIQQLQEPASTCSLKCSSLIQAAETCLDSAAFLAQLDADTIPHPTWLRELATALSDERVGAASGNRWYMPAAPNWGSLARYAWNAAAIVQMFWYRIPWGGTLAIRTQVIREAGLLERWRQAFCEDTMLFRLLRDAGWKVAFAPGLMMINRETCSLAGFRRWIARQLLTARLYHPRWPAVALHGLGTTAILLASAVLLAAALILGQTPVAALLAGGLAVYQLTMWGMLFLIEGLVRRIAEARGEQTRWLSPGVVIRILCAVPLTQLVYPWCLLAAMRLREVDWRGVTYQIGGPWRIRLNRYRPYVSDPAEETSVVSL